ncbi:hypothetical protein V8E36_001868 [Tilletia maclaganii]
MPTEVTKEELEELNAQRIKLGLKPLEVETSDSKPAAVEEQDPDALAEANFARVRDEARRDREQKALEERIAKAKNKRELSRRLVGRSLGAADDESSAGAAGGAAGSESTLSWLKASKKRAKENAARRLQQQIEDEEAQVQAEYGAEDLAGLRVGHEMDDFEEGGEERILTLRDAKVLDEGAEDELVDSLIAQRERDEENAERKKGAKKYTGLDDDDFGGGTGAGPSVVGLGKKRGVLAKYDDELSAGDAAMLRSGEDVGFRIGGGPKKSREEIRAQQAEEAARLANRQLLNLDYSKNVEVSDYLQEGDVGFKKTKGNKKKRSATRVKVDLDDDDASGHAGPSAPKTEDNGDVAMDDNPAPITRRPRVVETDNFVDDDELQASLAKARRAKAKKTLTKLTPEQIAANLAAQKKEEEDGSAQQGDGSEDVKMEDAEGSNGLAARGNGAKAEVGADEEQALTFDSTTEFVRNLAFKAAAEEPRRLVKTEAAEPTVPAASSSNAGQIKQETSGGDTVLPSRATSERQVTVQDAPIDEDEEMADEDMERIEVFAVPANDDTTAGEDPEEGEDNAPEPSAAAEPLAGGGMAATLSLLRNQGLLQAYTPDLREKEAKQREYDLWMAEQRRRERVREAELAASKARGSAVDQATREMENQQRDMADARDAQRRFANYKPDVDIKYHDQYGRELDSKKAWKILSHKFHGKGPGHKKQELELRRLENERKREKMQSGDTPTGMSKAFQDRSERTGQAHMVLSVGAKGNAPQELSMLGPDITKAALPSAGRGALTKGGKGGAAAGGAGGGSKGKGKARGPAEGRPELLAGISSGIGLQSFVPRNVGGSGLASVLPPSGSASRLPSAMGGGLHSAPSGDGAMIPPPPPPPPGGPQVASRPTMKPAFAPIKRGAGEPTAAAAAAAAHAPSAASAASLNGSGGGGFKLQLGSKRKADDPAPAAQEARAKRRA